MPNETDKDRSYLVGEREAVLTELQERGCFEQFRSKEPELVDRYLKLSAAIVSYDAAAAEISASNPESEEYREILNPLKAVETLLSKVGRPLAVDDIARSLQEGGWAKGRIKYPHHNIKYAVANHTKKKLLQRKKVKLLKEVNGLIGKIEWPDEMFAIQEEKE